MSTTKFKPGDKVIYIGDEEDEYTKGKVYKVKQFENHKSLDWHSITDNNTLKLINHFTYFGKFIYAHQKNPNSSIRIKVNR